MTLQDAEILIDPNIHITVIAGSVLRINHSHLFGCSNRWRGITVDNGGRLYVDNNALIEDAYIAVLSLFNPNTSQPPAIIDAKNSIFNKNTNGIFINQSTNNTGNYPFTLTNCVFTSRKLPGLLSSGLTTNALKSVNNLGVLDPPYINNSLYQPTFVLGTNNYPSAGITLQHVGTTTNVNLASASNAPIYQELEIGSNIAAKFNLFDNHIMGIYAVNTNFTCHNAVFQNTILQNGIGIKMIAAKGTNNRCRILPSTTAAGTITGTHNRFYNCRRGIDSRDYFEMQVEKCAFRSLQFVNPIATSTIGEFGYRGTSNRFHLYKIDRDTFYNIGNPVAFFGTQSPTPFAGTIFVQYSGDISVSENTIRPYPTLANITTEYISNAITVNNAILPAGTWINNANTYTINIYKNSIAEVYRGILSENWTQKWQPVRDNDISLRLQPPLGADIPIQYGIRLVNDIGIPPFGAFPTKIIINNDISGFGLSFPNTFGMIHSGNAEMQVTCNHVFDTDKGFQFTNGLSPNIIFRDNLIEKQHFGYSLENNGLIGAQSSPTNPSDNQWIGTWTPPTHWMTNVVSSFSGGSILYIRSAPAQFNPQGFGTASGIAAPYDFSNSNLFIVLNPPNPFTCPALPNLNAFASPLSLFEDIAMHQIPYYGNTQVAEFINEFDLYNLLENEPQWRDSSVLLDSFYLVHQSVVYGQFYTIDTTIAQADWQTAQSLINSFSPNSAVEDNYKNYFTWYVKIQSDTLGLTDEENQALFDLATTCVAEGGRVVSYAQALYNVYNDTLVVFADTCGGGKQGNRIANSSSLPLFRISPNPTSDDIRLLVNQQENFAIEIQDIQGKTVEYIQHQALDGEVIIKNSFSAGIYFIHLTNSISHESQTQKLVIY